MAAVPAEAQESAAGPAGRPRHVAIIMDGNGRWAKDRGISRARGHSQGGEALRTASQRAAIAAKTSVETKIAPGRRTMSPMRMRNSGR